MFDSFFQICLYLDSAAARGIINRRGVGKVRHLSCRSLWLQGRLADGSMIVSPISGLKNPTDIGTKRLNVQRMKALMFLFLLGMFDSMNNCQVGEVEARTILQHQELKQSMSSLRRLVKSDVDASGVLQLVMLMNALGLARGDGDELATTSVHGVGLRWWLAYALQILTLVACMIAGVVILARGLARRRDLVAHDVGVLGGEVPAEDEAGNDAGETASDRWYRYKNCSMSECSDPEYWMELNHIELSTSESEVDVGPNPVRDRWLEVAEDSNISNRAIASWLFSRVKRRLENVTDEADTVILTEMYYALSVGLINMTNGNLPPSFEQVRGIVLGQSNIAYDADSPSASLSMAEMREEIVQSELHVTEHYLDGRSWLYLLEDVISVGN